MIDFLCFDNVHFRLITVMASMQCHDWRESPGGLTLACQILLQDATDVRFGKAAAQRGQPDE